MMDEAGEQADRYKSTDNTNAPDARDPCSGTMMMKLGLTIGDQ